MRTKSGRPRKQKTFRVAEEVLLELKAAAEQRGLNDSEFIKDDPGRRFGKNGKNKSNLPQGAGCLKKVQTMSVQNQYITKYREKVKSFANFYTKEWQISVIPLRPNDKAPAIPWQQYQKLGYGVSKR